MISKYLKDLGLKEEDTPQGWCPLDDIRQKDWKEEREIYGFDQRETWSLDHSLMIWLYERLSMYNEVNIVNTTLHKFNYKEEIITFQDCIDRMLEGLKIYLITDEYNRTKEHQEKIDDVIPILALCYRCLWW